MGMFRFIHAADIHLDSPLRGLERYEGAPLDEIRGATRRAFENLTELAIEEDVAFVLIAGDLYDGDWKDHNTGLFFARQMARLREAGVDAFIAAGNHDAASQITRFLRLPDNVHTFSTRRPESISVEHCEAIVHGQGFATRAVTDDLSAGYPPAVPGLFNIGVLHTSADGRPGHERYAPCTADGLRARGYQYWALGHVHQREVLSREPWIVFPGNIQGRHIREAGPRGCTLVTVEGRDVVAVEHRDLDVLRWALCRVDVSGAPGRDAVYDRVREALQCEQAAADGRSLAVRLLLHGSCGAHAAMHAAPERWVQDLRVLATELGAAGLWLEKVVFETHREVSLEEAMRREDALGGLLRALRELELDAGTLRGMAGEFGDFRHRLPVELLQDEGGFDPTDPERLGAMLEDVREVLVNRLLGHAAETGD
jgi:exonuclease SbcD